jgi:hypothetical protein
MQPSKRTIVLFQFHAHFEHCKPRIRLLRTLNPGLPIFGLYGGEGGLIERARELERLGLEDVYQARSTASNRSRWKDTDLGVVDWYSHVGRSVPFDRVHVIQWDLLFFAPLVSTYPALPDAAVALTGLIPLAEVAPFWDWIAAPGLGVDSEALFVLARQRFGYAGRPYACIGPGYSLSRDFIERYSALDIGEVGHDELRLPLFAQVLGIELVDTGFYPRWRDPEIEKVFNADSCEIEPAQVRNELARTRGRRVFHPCRERFDSTVIDDLTLVSLATRAVESGA